MFFISLCTLVIGLILGYRVGLEKALKDPHYAHGFIEGFGFKPLWNMIRGKK